MDIITNIRKAVAEEVERLEDLYAYDDSLPGQYEVGAWEKVLKLAKEGLEGSKKVFTEALAAVERSHEQAQKRREAEEDTVAFLSTFFDRKYSNTILKDVARQIVAGDLNVDDLSGIEKILERKRKAEEANKRAESESYTPAGFGYGHGSDFEGDEW